MIADDQEKQVGGAERLSAAASAYDSHGPGEVEGEGGSSGQHVGTFGASSQVGAAFLFGGIVAQLIQDAQDRRAESQECVEWYQRELEKCDRRIAALQSLSEGISSLDK